MNEIKVGDEVLIWRSLMPHQTARIEKIVNKYGWHSVYLIKPTSGVFRFRRWVRNYELEGVLEKGKQ